MGAVRWRLTGIYNLNFPNVKQPSYAWWQTLSFPFFFKNIFLTLICCVYADSLNYSRISTDRRYSITVDLGIHVINIVVTYFHKVRLSWVFFSQEDAGFIARPLPGVNTEDEIENWYQKVHFYCSPEWFLKSLYIKSKYLLVENSWTEF